MFIKRAYKIGILIYTIILLYLMFLGFGREPMEMEIVRVSPIYSTFHFIENRIFFKQYFSIITNFFGNIVMFIPYGLLGILHSKYTNFIKLMMDFITILIIVEGLQYFTRLGVFDVDDILLNTFGVYIGFWIFKKWRLKRYNFGY